MTGANDVAIVGIGDTPVGRMERPSSSLALCTLATRDALRDAGITKDMIDGVITTDAYTKYHARHAVQLAEYMGLSAECRLLETGTSGSSLSSGQAIQYARAVLMSGDCNYVLVASGDNLLSSTNRGDAVRTMSENYDRDYEVPFGPIVPTRFAWSAMLHMHQYGTRPEHLARVAVAARFNAGLNPNAHYREPITIEDVLTSKMISTPLHMLDCAPVSDGGGAYIVTTAERARELKQEPVWVAGVGTSYGSGRGFVHDSCTQMEDYAHLGAWLSGQRAFSDAQVERKEVDALMCYDGFSINVLLYLEALGFCAPGDSGPFVADGHIDLNGSLPVNTHGGLLSGGHPGKPGGIFMFTESVRQLRGQAKDRQLRDPALIAIQGHGAHHGIHVTVLLQRR